MSDAGALCGVAKPSVAHDVPDFSPVHREDLKNYWQMVVSIDKVVDFAKHHCSAEIKAFLQVDENTRNKVRTVFNGAESWCVRVAMVQ
jgi:hypothetical protein